MSGGRVAVVTGASSGIGEATARELARRGWSLVLLARREERLAAVAGDIGAEWEVCDVADRAQVDAVAARILERHPAVALLVNNAGIPARGSYLDIEPERIEQVIACNYLGGVWCLRAFEPGLRAAAGGGGAHVVNVVSVAGTVAFASPGAYSASKHTQIAFSRSNAGAPSSDSATRLSIAFSSSRSSRSRGPPRRCCGEAASGCTRSCLGSWRRRGSRSEARCEAGS